VYVLLRLSAHVSHEPNKVVCSAYFFPFGRYCAAQRELALNLPLSQILNLSVYEIPETLQIQTALSARAHENISPDSPSGYGVVDAQLNWAMKADQFLSYTIRILMHCIWPCGSN
jgi:hypothetical protein